MYGRMTRHSAVIDYLNRPDVRTMLGVDAKVGNFTGCSPDVSSGFHLAGDLHHSSRVYIEELLERGIRVLQFAGQCIPHVRGSARH